MAQVTGRGEPDGAFRQAVDFIESGLNYEKTQRWKYNRKWLDLSRMEGLLAAMGQPHRSYKVIHVAGTKGKGSTAGAAAHCLHRMGHASGLLTSPHLVTPCERVCVNGRMIGEEDFGRIVRQMEPYVEAKRQEEGATGFRAPTYFEMLTAVGFQYFRERGVEWAVVEVGLGGRLDSTNVVTPSCCVITTIGFDHTDKLGFTPEAIATEKAGILKPGVPVVLGRQQYPGALETLRRAAQECGCPSWEVGRDLVVSDSRPTGARAPRARTPRARTPRAQSRKVDADRAPRAQAGWRFSLETPARSYKDLFTPLLGAHQVDNLVAAIGALDMAELHAGLKVEPERVAEAIADFRMMARIEVLQEQPVLILDVAHTVESVMALVAALDAHFPRRRLRLVFGCSADKNVDGMLSVVRGRCASLVATQSQLPRALPAPTVAETARRLGIVADGALSTIPDAWDALQHALAQAQPGDVVCVTGSFYVAGEVRASWLVTHPQPDA